MKVLLTGANGFVGSHILDHLCQRGIATAVLLRRTSRQEFIESHLPQMEVRFGSLSDPESLVRAMADVTHVVHCSGLTKALRTAEFYEVNQAGTRHLVEAVNRQPGRIQRLVLLSSLAAAGPAPADRPVREEDPPHPVSEYGQSKLGGEQEVTQRCQSDYVILRPPAVYGPRDREFLRLFRAAKAHLQPRFGGGRQALSLVFVKDLAEATVACLTHPAAARTTFYVASPEVVTTRLLAEEVAAQMRVWTVPLALPMAVLWPVCCLQEAASRLTGKPSVLSRQKYAELQAPRWVCDPTRLAENVGYRCATGLKAGIAQTLTWYKQAGWL